MGGVVHHKQDQVTLIRSSQRLGQRCSKTCCPCAADKLWITWRKKAVCGHSAKLLRAQLPTAHSHDAVTVRRALNAGGSLLVCGSDRSWGEWRENLQHLFLVNIQILFIFCLIKYKDQTLFIKTMRLRRPTQSYLQSGLICNTVHLFCLSMLQTFISFFPARCLYVLSVWWFFENQKYTFRESSVTLCCEHLGVEFQHPLSLRRRERVEPTPAEELKTLSLRACVAYALQKDYGTFT